MSAAARVTPSGLLFGGELAGRLLAMDEGIAAAGVDGRERDAFILVQEVVELLRDLRPDEGLGQGVDALVGLVHAAYLHWRDGEATVSVSESELRDATAGRADPAPSPTLNVVRYIQLPPRRVWGTPVEGESAEPLDGWFAIPKGSHLGVVAVFGLHATRGGFTVAEAEGPRPGRLAREDGTPLFTPTLAGGAAAGLASITGSEELLELAWRLQPHT